MSDDAALEKELAEMPPPPPVRKGRAGRLPNLAPPGTVQPAVKEEGEAPKAVPAAEPQLVIGPAGGDGQGEKIPLGEAPMVVGPVRREAGQPGALLRHVITAESRDLAANIAGISPDRQRHRDRVREMVKLLRNLALAAAHAEASVKALSQALVDSHGGQEEAEKEGFSLATARAFCEELTAVLDRHAPKSQQA